MQYMAFRSGPVTSNGAETAAFVNLRNSAEDPILQIYCIGVMWPDASGSAQKRTHGVSLLANLVKPRSRGTVRLSSGRMEDDAVINPNWLSDPFDREILLEALRYLREIAASAPLANIIRRETSPSLNMQSDGELLNYIRSTTESNYHPVGTCRMGKIDDPMAVLSPRLDVKGVSGLRVVDASMMPTIISANTNATVMAVADRAVDFIAGTNIQTRKAKLPETV
jgi:choline dehydrogenase-like flavoprotein